MVQKSSIKNFWMIFFGVVALLAIATSVLVGVYFSTENARIRMSVVDDENYYKVAQENNYRRSLYAACDHLKNLDASLGKASVSSDAENRTQMLTNAVVHANLINRYLANLPVADSDNLVACQKFVNQSQDYASFLLKHVASGNELTAEHKTALKNLNRVATNLYNLLQDYAESDVGMFVTNGNGANGVGALSNAFEDADNSLFSYEKLIYDGPFSDSVVQKTLNCKKISHEKARLAVEELFGTAVWAGELKNNGTWYCFETEKGRVVTASDGRIAQYDTYREPTGGEALSAEECKQRAQEFCRKLGYDVQAVWVSTVQNTTYVNCATVADGVVVYPDLVKVAVDASSGTVLGCEAKAYLLNHCDWQLNFGSVSQQEAQSGLDSTLKVQKTGKCVVEKNGKTHFCHEFQCESDGHRYFIYVDSQTGKEVEIFKVIQNTEGYTVM